MAYSGTHESPNRMADRLAHPSNLAISSLVNRDPKDSGRRLTHDRWRRAPVLKVYSLPQALDGPLSNTRRWRVNLDQVLLFNPSARVCQMVGQSAVICENDEPFGVHIKPANRKYPWVRRHERHHCWSIVGVDCGAHDTPGFVEQVVHETWGDTHFDTINLDGVLRRVDATSERRNRTIDVDPAVGDQFLTHST